MKLQSNRHRRTLLGSLIVASSLALAGVAYGQTSAPLGEMGANGAITPSRAELPDSAFSKLDTGSKGYLTREDTRSLSGFDFNAHDSNHDGRLTADEFSQAWQRYSGNASVNSSGNSPGVSGMNGSANGGAMAPRGGGVGGTTRTNGTAGTSGGTSMDSTSPAPAGSTAK